VVTALNLHKPRDRSHYERFTAWHESFYRHVEATSLTPFSAPALERGFAESRSMLTEDEKRFAAPTSMRDVEPSVHVWRRFKLGSNQ
jgi:hypothetical protein